jgi:hypothetical protein
MKNRILGLLIMTGMSQSSLAQEVTTTALAAIGRYQMIEATFSNPPDAAAKQSRRLVILDTMTGALTTCDFVYNDGGKDNRDGREYWGTNGICAPFSTQKGWYVPKTSKK